MRFHRMNGVTDGITEAENEAGMQFGDTGLNAIAHYDDVGSILDQVGHLSPPQGSSFARMPTLARRDCVNNPSSCRPLSNPFFR